MKNHSTLKKLLAIGLPLIVVVLLFAEFRIADNQWKDVVASDGRGYYHYFIEYFIADDQRDFSEESEYLQSHRGQSYTKYPMGTALLLSPFFAMGYGLALWGDYELSGLSYPFQLFAGIGALFYLFLGGLLLFKLLRTYRLSSGLAYLVTLILMFGTNLLYYAVMGSTMSHVFSFAAIAAFAYFVRAAVQQNSARHSLFAIILLGLIFSIRPFNILVILAVPLLTADFPNWLERIRKSIKPYAVISGALIFGLLVFLQLISWRHQTGDWILFSYSDEGFYFDRPAIFQVLLSFNKGLFIYTPLFILSIVGGFLWFQKSRIAALSFYGFFGIITYFIASWWCWNYASGFGLRPYIDFYAILAIPMAVGLSESGKLLRYIQFFSVAVFLSANLIQSYQYAENILHHSSMNWEKYVYVFLKTDESYSESLGGSLDLPPYAPNGLIHYSTFAPLVSAKDTLVTDEFAMSTEIDPENRPMQSHQLFWKINFEKKELRIDSSEDVLFVFDFEEDGKKVYYSTFKINHTPQVPVNEWETIAHTVTTPVPSPEATVKIYLWNRKKGDFQLRNYEVELYGTE